MIQTENSNDLIDLPAVPESPEESWALLKGLTLDDALSKIANSLVDFTFKLLIAILVFYVGRFIIRKIYRLINSIMTARDTDMSLKTFVLSLVNITLYFILIVTIVGILGVETSSFLAIFASAGVAVGMALSGTLQNFAGGVLILLLKPYRVGDFIDTGTYAGTVKAIQIFHTVLNTPDNKTILIPNGQLSTGSINNYTGEDYRRVDWTVSLAYETDYAAAEKAIKEILLADKRVVTSYVKEDHLEVKSDENGKVRFRPGHFEPKTIECPPFVGLNEMADSSINLSVRAWCHKADYWPLFFEMNATLFTELPKRGFSFPFPQMDVHMIPQSNDTK